MKRLGLASGSLPGVDAILETLLTGKARIVFAELDVGDVGIDLFLSADRQTLEGMIVAVGGELPALKIGFIFSDGDDVFFAPSTIGLMAHRQLWQPRMRSPGWCTVC